MINFLTFSGTHCLLRHHTQCIRPLQFGLFYTSIPTLIHLSTSVGFHYTLKQYGGWIRPEQLRCHYSTVKCLISLHETFQM